MTKYIDHKTINVPFVAPPRKNSAREKFYDIMTWVSAITVSMAIVVAAFRAWA